MSNIPECLNKKVEIKLPEWIPNILTDLPTQLKVNDELCHISCRFEPNATEDKAWVVEYLTAQNKETNLKTVGKDLGWVINRMIYTICNDRTTKSIDGNKFYSVKVGVLTNKEVNSTIVRHEIIKENSPDINKGLLGYNACQWCGSSNVSRKEYRSDPASWRALAGREGYVLTCKDCGYTYDCCTCMS